MRGQRPKAAAAQSGIDVFIDLDQAALDAIPTGLCVCTAEGVLVRYNRRAVELWGRAPRLGDPKEQHGSGFRRYQADGAPLPFGATPVATVLRTGQPIVGAEVIIEQPEGTRVPVLMNVAPLKSRSGRLQGAVCSFQALTERKRIEEALRASEAELQSVINRTPFMLVRCSRDLHYRFVSQAYAQLVGVRREAIIGKTIAEAIGDKGFNTLRPHIEKVLAGEATEFDCEIDFPEVGPRRLHIAYRPETDAAGKVDGWIASLLDITEQSRAVQAREQLASIVESSGDAIVSKDLNGIIVSWNRAAENLFGYAAEEVIGKSITILIPEELHDEEPKILERIRRGDSLDHYETIRQRKDGSRLPVSLSVSPVRDAHGTIVGASKIARDITARKQAEHERDRIEGELRELSAKLEQEVERRTLERDRIWNVSEDLLGVSNFEGYVLSMNPAWSRLLGWTEDEIKAMHVSELRHPDDGAHSEAGRKQLAQGVPTVRMENRFRHKDGTWRWLHWTMTEDNGLIYVAGRHVTAEKESAAALQQAQRQAAHLQKMEAIGQLTGGVAHDFNNLLMIVSGHAQSLKKRLSETRDIRALQAIEMAATRGENLTRQLLAFSRTLPLNPTVISLADTVAAIRDVLAGTMHVNIEFLIDVPAATWPVCVDKSELELALVNLAVNARDAMPDGGRIAIAAQNVSLNAHDAPSEAAGDYVALTVADTGCGIPADLLPRVVEPFFTTKGPDKGTGLGLSQVYGLAHRSGGTVQITSEIGHGTKVTIYLPRSDAPIAAPSPEDTSRYMAADLRTILVVEDNKDVKNVAVSLLEQLGYKTIAVESATEALDVLASGQMVNLVFTDVALPGQLDGLALARKVTDRYGGIPIVLTTGYTRAFDSEPEFPVLRKPYQIAALGRLIHQALYPHSSGAAH
ncbi:MAG: PAS domain S-box protein [Xanthobacteraceae bacterium]|jgi:PAS domain S-box-containing protein